MILEASNTRRVVAATRLRASEHRSSTSIHLKVISRSIASALLGTLRKVHEIFR